MWRRGHRLLSLIYKSLSRGSFRKRSVELGMHSVKKVVLTGNNSFRSQFILHRFMWLDSFRCQPFRLCVCLWPAYIIYSCMYVQVCMPQGTILGVHCGPPPSWNKVSLLLVQPCVDQSHQMSGKPWGVSWLHLSFPQRGTGIKYHCKWDLNADPHSLFTHWSISPAPNSYTFIKRKKYYIWIYVYVCMHASISIIYFIFWRKEI